MRLGFAAAAFETGRELVPDQIERFDVAAGAHAFDFGAGDMVGRRFCRDEYADGAWVAAGHQVPQKGQDRGDADTRRR